MDWAALFKVFQSWGPSAISSALVIITLYLIKRVDKNSEDDKKRAQGFRDCLEAKTKELRSEINKTIEDHGKRLSYIEMEYVKREYFFRELSGWRADINRLSDQVVAQFKDLNKGIIELWKEKGG